LGKPTVATVPPNFTPRLDATGKAANRPSPRLEQRQIIGRIHLHHLGGNQTCARDQTNLRGIFHDMSARNEKSIFGDEKTCAAG